MLPLHSPQRKLLLMWLAAGLLCVLLGGADALSKGNIQDSTYWELSPTHGFLPRWKSPAFVTPFTRSLQPLLEHDFSLTQTDRALFVELINGLPHPGSSADFSDNVVSQLSEPEVEDMFHALVMLFANYARISGMVNSTAETLVVPRGLAVPLFVVADVLKRVPAVAYPSLVLDNCERNADGSWKSQRLLSNRVEEDGFYISHCQQEEALAPAVYAAAQITRCIRQIHGVEGCGAEFLTKNLFTIADSVRSGISSIKRIYRNISPASFFKDVRPYMKYLPQNVIVEFEGVNSDGSSLAMLSDEIAGPTGAQTSSVPFLDALLGVTISDHHLNALMLKFRRYQPHLHRKLVEDAESISSLFRFYVKASKVPQVQYAFDDALTAISEWRASHVILTNEYIQKQIPGEALGTGKTKFHRYLCQHLQETMNARVNPLSSTSVAIPDLCRPVLRELENNGKQGGLVEQFWQVVVPVMNALVARLDVDLLH
eukprot:TRINITY_DN960_c0_g1_i5.p1 TRINITY_DN960_c0_g1~~TRINITY_DN960_c0_g1_i5.p1  ORF type:complete len:485 (-),score=122.52 TRINITY_DN960_c0_g1_i5:82-1536(-)